MTVIATVPQRTSDGVIHSDVVTVYSSHTGFVYITTTKREEDAVRVDADERIEAIKRAMIK